MQTTKYWAPSLLALAIASPAMASDLNINGFLSVGATMLDDDKVEVAGADTQGGFKQNTILGLQVSKQVNDSTSVTGQLVSRGSDDYSTEAAWAFVTYAANDNLDLRMGRLRIPAFYYSDFLEVGYTYNSIRPAEEVYRLPFSSFTVLISLSALALATSMATCRFIMVAMLVILKPKATTRFMTLILET